MPGKKRRLSKLPAYIEQYSQLATMCGRMYELKKQKFQHELLVKQIYSVTSIEDSFDIEESAILKKIISWHVNIQREIENTINKRDVALKKLRSIDVLDDDALKKSALCLTNFEGQLAALETQVERLRRIVRYENKSDLKTHIKNWLARFFRQYKKTQSSIDEMSERIKDLYRQVEL